MSPYTWLVSKVIFPMQEWLKGHSTVAVRRELEQTQWLRGDEIEALQRSRLKDFLLHVQKTVPYYRELFQQLQFDPAAVRSLSDLAKLPLLDKKTIRENTDKLKSSTAGKLAQFNTGGSSGTPLIFYLGKERVSHDVAAKWRATRWWGVDIGDPEIVVWGSPIELKTQDRIKLVRDKLFRSTLLSAFDLTQANLDQFVAEIRRIKPKMLFGYPSVISMLAKHAQEKGIDMTGLGISVIFCTSECLYDHQRDIMELVFGCQVANGYGGRDAGFIAHQCPEGGMHLSAEDLIVEIIDGNGNPLPAGEPGEIVVTNMATGEFPFIRYRIGDCGVLSNSTCPCGRGLPMLEKVHGRTNDLVVSENGTRLHAASLTYVMRQVSGIDAFKIIQSENRDVSVQIVQGAGYSKDSEIKITDALEQRLGSSVQVEIQYMQVIPAEVSGKYRYVISKAL